MAVWLHVSQSKLVVKILIIGGNHEMVNLGENGALKKKNQKNISEANFCEVHNLQLTLIVQFFPSLHQKAIVKHY